MSIFGDVLGFVGASKQASATKKAAQAEAEAQKYAADKNFDIAMQNLDLQKLVSDWQRSMADKTFNIGLEGTTDARGTRVSYVPGKGYVTALDPVSSALQDRTDMESMKQLMLDTRMRRRGMEANEFSRSQDRNLASQVLAELQYGKPTSEESLRGDILKSATSGYNRSFDKNAEAIARQALRTGTSATGMLDDINEQRASGLAGIEADAALRAREGAESLNSSRTSRLGSLYRDAVNGATNFDNISIATPSITSGTGNSNLLQTGAGISAGARTPQLNYSQPIMTGAANKQLVNSQLWSSLGNVGSGIEDLINKYILGGNKPQTNTGMGDWASGYATSDWGLI